MSPIFVALLISTVNGLSINIFSLNAHIGNGVISNVVIFPLESGKFIWPVIRPPIARNIRPTIRDIFIAALLKSESLNGLNPDGVPSDLKPVGSFNSAYPFRPSAIFDIISPIFVALLTNTPNGLVDKNPDSRYSFSIFPQLITSCDPSAFINTILPVNRPPIAANISPTTRAILIGAVSSTSSGISFIIFNA